MPSIKKTLIALSIAAAGAFLAPAAQAQSSKEKCPAYGKKVENTLGGMKIKKENCRGVPEKKKLDRRDPDGGWLKKLFMAKNKVKHAHHKKLKRVGKHAKAHNVGSFR